MVTKKTLARMGKCANAVCLTTPLSLEALLLGINDPSFVPQHNYLYALPLVIAGLDTLYAKVINPVAQTLPTLRNEALVNYGFVLSFYAFGCLYS